MGRRLFVSVDLPSRLAEPVEAVQDRFRDAEGLNCTDPEQAHVTLKFLGETPPERVELLRTKLSEAVEDAAVDPFDVTFSGLGVFPEMEYIRVVWLGVSDGGEELTELHEAVESWTTAMGYDPVEHEFTPHVTLGRMEHAGGKDIVQRAVRDASPTVGTAHIESVRLTESELGPGGPTYSTLERFEL